MEQLDKIDWKIISILSKNARISLSHLSEQVYLTPPAVSSRIEKLEKAGIITGYKACINYEKIGLPITAYIEVTIPPHVRDEFCKYVEADKRVLECYYLSGDYSMLLKVTTPITTDLDAFFRLLQKFGRMQTRVVLLKIFSRDYDLDTI